jgi:putative acyl-CoA dehydrogenase
VEAYFVEVGKAVGVDRRFDDAAARLRKELSTVDALEVRARRVAELMALVLQGAQLLQHGPAAVADAFCASRLDRDWGGAFGTLPAGLDLAPILERAFVDVPVS